MKKLRYIIPIFAIIVFSISAIAQDPPAPGGGGAPSGGNTPVSTPLSAAALVVVAVGVAVVAWKAKNKRE